MCVWCCWTDNSRFGGLRGGPGSGSNTFCRFNNVPRYYAHVWIFLIHWSYHPSCLNLFITVCLFKRYNCHHGKTVDPPLATSEMRQILLIWRHIDDTIYLALTMYSTVNNSNFRYSFSDNLMLLTISFSANCLIWCLS